MAAGKTKVLLAKFDPAAVGNDWWKVSSIDGKAPSLYENNTFCNTRAKPPVDKPAESTYRIDSETADHMVISYKLDAASIPMDARFLKDCRVVLAYELNPDIEKAFNPNSSFQKHQGHLYPAGVPLCVSLRPYMFFRFL